MSTAASLALRCQRAVIEGEVRPATVVVSGGKISAILDIDDAVQADRVATVASGVLLPGLVDTHVHINEPGRTEWEGFNTATQAAAAGGITTLVDMPLNCSPVTRGTRMAV